MARHPLKQLSIIVVAASLLLLLLDHNVSRATDQPAASSNGQPLQNTSNLNKLAQTATTTSSANFSGKPVKCSRQSIILTRQALRHELDSINSLGPVWLYDLSRDELLESQRESLASLILLGSSSSPSSAANWNQLSLVDDKSSSIELEASYFRSAASRHTTESANITSNNHNHSNSHWPMLKLLRRHQDRCQLLNGRFLYTFGISLGPIEHNLDVVYNYNRELRLSQPNSWRYSQIRMKLNEMQYEVSLSQSADYKLKKKCPIQITDLTYISAPSTGNTGNNIGLIPSTNPVISLTTSGIALNNNQTLAQLDRLFSDYTRPSISTRLKQLLKFQLNSKTLPFSPVDGFITDNNST